MKIPFDFICCVHCSLNILLMQTKYNITYQQGQTWLAAITYKVPLCSCATWDTYL